MEKIKKVMLLLIRKQELELKYRDHKLIGNDKGRREYHIEPDWLLIYKVDRVKAEIIFEKTGKHADLFK